MLVDEAPLVLSPTDTLILQWFLLYYHRYFINIFIALNFSESSKMIWIMVYNLCILGAVTLTQQCS